MHKEMKSPVFERLICNNKKTMYGLQANEAKDSYLIWEIKGGKCRIIAHIKTAKGAILTMNFNDRGKLKIQSEENSNFN